MTQSLTITLDLDEAIVRDITKRDERIKSLEAIVDELDEERETGTPNREHDRAKIKKLRRALKEERHGNAILTDQLNDYWEANAALEEQAATVAAAAAGIITGLKQQLADTATENRRLQNVFRKAGYGIHDFPRALTDSAGAKHTLAKENEKVVLYTECPGSDQRIISWWSPDGTSLFGPWAKP